LESYTRIATDDIDSSVQLDVHLRYLADNLVRVVGDVRGQAICDLGSGKGYTAQCLLDGGAKSVTCVDISLPYLAELERYPALRLVQANAESLPFKAEFDLLVCTDVLEHVLNVGSVLLSTFQALRVGGRIVIRVPCNENLVVYSPMFGCKYDFAHLRTFNGSLARDTLLKAGFSVENLSYDAYWNYLHKLFWGRSNLRRRLLAHAIRWLRFDSAGPLLAPIRSLRHRLARLFFIPTMLIITARKTREVSTDEYSGFQFIPDL